MIDILRRAAQPHDFLLHALPASFKGYSVMEMIAVLSGKIPVQPDAVPVCPVFLPRYHFHLGDLIIPIQHIEIYGLIGIPFQDSVQEGTPLRLRDCIFLFQFPEIGICKPISCMIHSGFIDRHPGVSQVRFFYERMEGLTYSVIFTGNP